MEETADDKSFLHITGMVPYIDDLARKPSVGQREIRFAPWFQHPRDFFTDFHRLIQVFYRDHVRHDVERVIIEWQNWVYVQVLNHEICQLLVFFELFRVHAQTYGQITAVVLWEMRDVGSAEVKDYGFVPLSEFRVVERS